MTTCPRCGLVSPSGTPTCPRCNTRLAAYPTDASSEWMRSNHPNQPYPPYTDGQLPYTPPMPPAPGSTPSGRGSGSLLGNGAPPRIAVNSLINEDALPDWLRNAANSGALPPPMSSPSPTGSPQGPTVLAGNGWEPIAQSLGGSAPLVPQDVSGGYGPYGQPPTQRPTVMPSPVSTGGLEANKLFDESSLPEWLRAGAIGDNMDQMNQWGQGGNPGMGPAAMPNNPNYGAYGAPGGYAASSAQMGQPQVGSGPLPPTSNAFPGIERAGTFSPSPSQTGMSGPSLIDANALPQWLSGQQNSAVLPGNGRDSSQGMPAGSLVDDKALPQWLRNEPATPSDHSRGNASWATPGAGNEALPSWLNQQYGDGQAARREPPSALPSAWNSSANQAGRTVQPRGVVPGTIAGNEFVDESALPEWLRSQNGMSGALAGSGANPAASSYNPFGGPLVGTGMNSGDLGGAQWNQQASAQPANPASQQGGFDNSPASFSASDLIDPTSLPDWVQGKDAGPTSKFSSTSGWTSRQPAAQQPLDPSISSMTSRAAAMPPTSNGPDSWTSGGLLNDDNDDDSLNTWRARVPEPSSNGQRQTNQNAAIPRNELPSWLMNNVPEPLQPRHPPQPPTASQVPGRRVPPQPQRLQRPPQQPSDGRMARQNQQPFTDDGWDNDPYAPENYAQHGGNGNQRGYNNFRQNDAYADQQEPKKQRGGWRRFFGRK